MSGGTAKEEKMGPGGPIPSMDGVHKALLEWAEWACAIHDKRLAAVRALVLEYGSADSPAIEALAAVWPEAVEGVR